MGVSKKYIYIYSLIAVFIWIGGSGSALGQEPLSFYDAISKALENNYDIRIAQKELDVAQNNNNPGAAGMWPSITLSANQRNQFIDQNNPKSQQTFSNEIAPGLNLNWLIFGGFSVQITREKLSQLENLSDGMHSLVVENTLQAVVLAYQKALLEKEQLELTRQLMQLSADLWEYTGNQKKYGNATTFDVQQAHTSYLEDSSNNILQGVNYRNALRNLNLIMGEEPTKSYVLSGTFEPILEDLKLASIIEQAQSNNQTLRNQFINQSILESNVQLGKSRMYPTFSLSTGVNYTYGSAKIDDLTRSTSDPLMVYGNFSLNFNLFDGGNVRRSIQNAQIDLEKNQLQTEQMHNRIKMQLSASYDLYNVRKQLYAVAVENEQLRQINLDLADRSFKRGTINSINFRQVQLNYLNASLAKLQSIYNLMDAYTEVMRLSGGILQQFDMSEDQ
ncbi:MAG: TolC family protein [Salinivirgaceae bacterium]